MPPLIWKFVGIVLAVAALLGIGFLYGELHCEAKWAEKSSAELKVALAKQAQVWKIYTDGLSERYKTAIKAGNILAAQVRERDEQIDSLTQQARQEVANAISDRAECRVPVSVVDRINSLSMRSEPATVPTPHASTRMPATGRAVQEASAAPAVRAKAHASARRHHRMDRRHRWADQKRRSGRSHTRIRQASLSGQATPLDQRGWLDDIFLTNNTKFLVTPPM